jgi:hypothetical protein
MIDAEHIIKTARDIIVKGEVSPMLFVSYKDEDEKEGIAMVVFNVPMEHKHEAMRSVGHRFANEDCDAIAMISEAWISKVDMKTHPDVKVEDIVPHDDPNRSEALVYVMLDREGKTDFKMFEIERGLDGPVLIEQKQEGVTFEPFLLQQFWKGREEKRRRGRWEDYDMRSHQNE